jgi:hypothetical protein
MSSKQTAAPLLQTKARRGAYLPGSRPSWRREQSLAASTDELAVA